MKRVMFAVGLFLLLGIGSAWAGVIGDTNAADFTDTVDWCQFGCAGAAFATPQAWTSSDGRTGLIGLDGTGQQFYNLQQGPSWSGNFPAGMGLIYNGAYFGNIPTKIAGTGDVGVYGIGAWVQNNFLANTATATIELFDSTYQSLGTYSIGLNPFQAAFIGAYINTPDVWAVTFNVLDSGGNQDFAIGTMGLMDELPGQVPEPTTFLLLGPALLGLGLMRRRG